MPVHETLTFNAARRSDLAIDIADAKLDAIVGHCFAAPPEVEHVREVVRVSESATARRPTPFSRRMPRSILLP
jgi:hypothetical protein